ncbi:MAG: TonB-dependent receptor plug domain-containing protein [Bacteroidota bacterium]|nr:TonB-dependent receptor plug domain-containing protein [Bacteroidota bacterium]
MMGKVYCLVVLLFVSVNAFAQKKDAVKSNSVQIGGLDDPTINKEVKPLILLDGKVYTGLINQINPDSIAEVNVVRDTTFIKRFGKQAINGIVFITTKGHQNVYTAKNNDSWFHDQGTIMPKGPLVIIDDKVIADSLESYSVALKSINPAEIMSVSVLKDAAAAAIYGVRGINGVIIITTKHNKKGNSLIKKSKNQ